MTFPSGPFGLADWTNPRGVEGSLALRTWIQKVGPFSTDITIPTDLPGLGPNWPTLPLASGTDLGASAHPAPIFTLVNCTGCADAIDLSNPDFAGLPAFCRSKRTYTNVLAPEAVRLYGRLEFIKFTVSQIDSGTAPCTLNLLGRFGISNAVNPDGSREPKWNPVGDLKALGTRIITPFAVQGAVGNDSLSIPGAIFFAGIQSIFASPNVVGDAIVTIEVHTFQFAMDPAPVLIPQASM